MLQAEAVWRGVEYRDLVAIRHDWNIDAERHWFLASTFEGVRIALGFATATPASRSISQWPGIDAASWVSSLDELAYVAAVSEVRMRIAAGDVYQANICRVLSAPLPLDARLRDLWEILDRQQGARYSGFIDVPPCLELPEGLGIVSASPECFLERRGGLIRTSPIKGTAVDEASLLDKDRAENLMITDLMRNDCSPVCEPGTVRVAELFALEQHPGLVHLVSHVDGHLRVDASWDAIAAAMLPAGSVSGAPKSSALKIIHEREGRARGHYCGVFGMAHGTNADLAVGIRSFFRVGAHLEFGTGAGITWGSDPAAEWAETVLKASRLIAICAHRGAPAW